MPLRKDPLSEPYEGSQFVAQVGTRIRLLRLARKLTQADLAERVEISRSTLMAIESGSLASRFADIARLLWALDDVSLQAALATAAADSAYQEALQRHLPRFQRRRSARQP